MERKLKILKAILLLHRTTRHGRKKELIAMANKYYSDKQLDEWIDELKNPIEKPTDIYADEYPNMEEEKLYTSSTEHDYSPSNPWDAPGMSIHDFI